MSALVDARRPPKKKSRHLQRVDSALKHAIIVFHVSWATGVISAVFAVDLPATLLALPAATIAALMAHAGVTAHSSARRHWTGGDPPGYAERDTESMNK